MAAQTTSVTIDGSRTELVGARYRVRYGRDSKILEDVELAERAANGDLIFSDPYVRPSRIRVRPSTIDALFGSGTEAIDYGFVRIGGVEPRSLDASGDVDYTGFGLDDDGEFRTSPAPDGHVRDELIAELARQAEVDALVESAVADGDRDPDSVAAKVEAELRRRAGSIDQAERDAERAGDRDTDRLATKRSAVVRGIAGILDGTATVASVNAELRDLADLSGESIVSPRLDGETAAAYLARLERPIPKGLGAAYVRWIETDPGQRALEAARVESDQARKVVPPPKLTSRGRAKLVEAGADPEAVAAATSAEDVVQVVVDGTVVAETRKVDAARGAKPYALRNKVWKCGTCKRRLRLAECANGHAPVAAPAGKRLADRVS